MSTRRIPKTDSIQELARFWDTHELSDFEDQLEVVTEPVFERQTVVKVPLTANEIVAIKKIARSQGVRYLDLIRQWIREKVPVS